MTRRIPQLLLILAFYILWLNPLHGLLKKWSMVLPEGWDLLPYSLNFLITAAAMFIIYHTSLPNRRLPFWLIPALVSLAALVSYLRW